MSGMNELRAHYSLLLGLDESWQVDSVDLILDEQRVEIRLEHRGGSLVCPECGQACPQADLAPERTWRHLDTMQFLTELRARVPRCKCSKCGVKTTRVPWAGKHSRFTLLFEAFAVEVLQACSNVKRASQLLRLSWDTVHSIMKQAVDRGLARRSVESVTRVGMDEKAFKKGHSYVSILSDIDGRRVLDVALERTQAAAEMLWETLPEAQRRQVKAVAVDMWQPYIKAAQSKAPQADVVHDKFHISAHLNEAVDQVRRGENKQLRSQGDERLKGTRQLWLFREENLTQKQAEAFEALKDLHLKTSRAWAIKENFQGIWTFHTPGWAENFFERWYAWAIRSQLTPIKKKAAMLKAHLPNVLNYFKHFITNAISEGFNSSIQAIKSAAKGFRNFEHFRIRILFYCGKLDLRPELPTH
jgi:transposase